MKHVPTSESAHPLSMIELLLAKGTLVVISLKDMWDHVELL